MSFGDKCINIPMDKPFFSVLLPTYNRADFLPLAIRSVLQQSFADFELIVSNGGSTDNTKQVVAELKDERIRYVETIERLNMGENYENALNQANGEYIIFFSDDDAFVPTTLERIKKVINEYNALMVIFPIAYYFHEETEEFGHKIPGNTLAFLPYSGKVKCVKSRYTLEQMLGSYNLKDIQRDDQHTSPFIGNVAYHHSINDQIKSKTQSFFAIIPIDIYFITMVLGVIDQYYVLNEPLLVWSRWSKNSTASFGMKGDALRQHYEKLLNGKSLNYVPLKFPLPTNCYANAVLQANDDLGDILDYSNIDWTHYFTKKYEYLTHLQEIEINTAREFEEFHKVLSEQPPELQTSVENKIHSTNSTLEAKLKKMLRTTLPSISQALRNKFKTSKEKTPKIIKGKAVGFNNFLESAEYLDRNLNQFSESDI